MRRLVAVMAIGMAQLPAIPTVCMAESTALDRPCESSDVVGTWDVIWMNAPMPLDHTQPYYYEYQRFAFSQDGKVTHVTSPQPFGELDDFVIEQFPTAGTYEVLEQGWIRMRQPDQEPEVCHCVCMLRDAEEGGRHVQRGDVLLTYVTPQGTPRLQRLLRRH